MRLGILAAFGEVNQSGGIHGRRLKLITKDDGYEPDYAVKNTNEFINDKNTFAFIGNVGTPTSKVTQPITAKRGIPFIAPFTGAEFLRRKELNNVINIRASYAQEAERWISYLIDQQGHSRIAIFMQDDSYGNAGLEGVKKALNSRGLTLVAEGRYKRNSIDISKALQQIRKGNPEAIVMVGAYSACSKFILSAKDEGVSAKFVNISFVGSKSLAQQLGAQGDGVIISEVVPNPYGNQQVVRRYRTALARLDPNAKPGFVSLEGYLAGRLTVNVLQGLGSNVTRQGFIDYIENKRNFSIDELEMTFGPDDNQGLDQVNLMVIDSTGTIKPIP